MTWGRAKKTEPYAPFLADDAIRRAAWDTPQSVLNFQIGTFFEGYLKTPSRWCFFGPALANPAPAGRDDRLRRSGDGTSGTRQLSLPGPGSGAARLGRRPSHREPRRAGKFIVDSDGPFDRAWLDTAFPPDGSDPDFTPAGTIVEVVFTMPMEPPFTEIRVGDRDPSRPIAYVSMEDLRPVRVVERS